MAPPVKAGPRRCRPRTVALAAALLCAAAALPRAMAAPPNLIFILTDDADAMHGVSGRPGGWCVHGTAAAGRAGQQAGAAGAGRQPAGCAASRFATVPLLQLLSCITGVLPPHGPPPPFPYTQNHTLACVVRRACGVERRARAAHKSRHRSHHCLLFCRATGTCPSCGSTSLSMGEPFPVLSHSYVCL